MEPHDGKHVEGEFDKDAADQERGKEGKREGAIKGKNPPAIALEKAFRNWFDETSGLDQWGVGCKQRLGKG